MMLPRRRLLLSTLAGAASLGIFGPRGVAAAPTPERSQVLIYSFRGFADVYSRGLEKLTHLLNRRGYYAYVYGYKHADEVTKHTAATYARGQRPILALIGHSLGANAVVQIATELDKLGIPVQLLVTFDATKPFQVPNNVQHIVNFYQNNGFGKELVPPPGFKGELTNIDLTADTSLTHITIDDADRLHHYVLGKIGAIVEKDLAQRVAADKKSNKSKIKN